MTATATVNTKGLVGQIIGDGRYDLRERLGGGSMGYVYRAFDRRLETDVVVKIPRKHKLESPDSLRRFRQESKFLVKLSHPHVVSILDVGEYDGVPFFVMPFISGGSLRSRQLSELGVQKPLKPTSLRRWLVEIAKALDYIHSQGCVHRDVKPDNILFDDHGNAFLSDFGLSKLLPTGHDDDPNHTAAGAIVGTPLFCAPELILGAPFDGRADQYSLALTVYDSLAGTNPFEGPNSSATLVNQTAMAPPLFSEFNSDVTPQLWRCMLKGLSKSADDRFNSCVEFAEAVLATIQSTRSSGSSGLQTQQVKSVQNSSSTNSAAETTSNARSNVGRITRAKSQAPPPSSRVSMASKVSYVVAGRTPIVKAKTTCPGCSANIVLQPAFAGKKATCQKCQCRLLISADFSELLKLIVANVRTESADGGANQARNSSDNANGEFDLVLGQEIFGWKLNRRWAYGLASALILFLLLMTVHFTKKASEAETARVRRQLNFKSHE